MDKDLSIALRCEAMTAFFEVGAKLPVVVDFAVEDHLQRAVFIADGLIAAGEIDDGQAAVRQADARLRPDPLRIGPAMGKTIRHRLEHGEVYRLGGIIM